MKAIYILWLRQVKRYFRSKARIIGSLAQPLLFLTALGFGFGPIFQKAGGGDYIQFLTPGIIAMSIIFTAVFTGIEIIWDRQFGFLKETLVAPISRFEIMIGRTLGGATVAVMQGVIVILLSLLVDFHPISWKLLPAALLFMFFIAVLFTAIGTAIASVLRDTQGFQLIINFFLMPVFFLSGALFPLDDLPGGIKAITKFNPLSYGVDGLRGTLANSFHLGLMNDILVLAITTSVLLCVGTYLFSKMEA